VKRSGICLLAGIMLSATAVAQEGSKTLASTLDVYVFPTEGQESSQQSTDEAGCYEWAVDNSGTDPFAAQQQQAASAEQAEAAKQEAAQGSQGAGARGAVRGAAAGAVIGEIANDDAGEGAAWGAAVGAVSSRRRARSSQQQAAAQVDAQQEQTVAMTEDQVENFKKAFSVCLEAKNYMVKY